MLVGWMSVVCRAEELPAMGTGYGEERQSLWDETTEESLLDEMDFEKVDTLLEDTMEEEVHFEDLVKDLIKGRIPVDRKMVKELLVSGLFCEVKENGKSVLYVLLLAVLSATLTNFTKVFDKSQTADISFYVVYMLLLTVLVASLKVVNSVAGGVLGQMTEFMKLLMPAYMITIAAANGTTTAAVFYEFLIVLIYAVNFLLYRVMLPMCNLYVVLRLVNNISKEDMLSKTAELIKTLISWGLKTLMAVVIGLNVVQGIITPAVDSFKKTAVHRAITAVPGVGNTMSAVTEVMVGSGMLIKNGVGVAILIVLIIICLVPVCKMTVFLLLYRVAAALVQPICDKRMLDCIYTVGEGSRLLLKCVTTALVLFFMTIAILTVSTGR